MPSPQRSKSTRGLSLLVDFGVRRVGLVALLIVALIEGFLDLRLVRRRGRHHLRGLHQFFAVSLR